MSNSRLVLFSRKYGNSVLCQSVIGKTSVTPYSPAHGFCLHLSQPIGTAASNNMSPAVTSLPPYFSQNFVWMIQHLGAMLCHQLHLYCKIKDIFIKKTC